MSYFHTNWRDCQAWKDEGLPLSTTSNEAVKMYDAVLTQMVNNFDDPSVGGIKHSMDSMIEADPNFVMGHVVTNWMELLSMGKSIHTDKGLKSRLNNLYSLAAKSEITQREKLHVSAVKELSEGNMAGACLIWEDILNKQPTDMFAIKMAYFSYIHLGYQTQLRDCIARVLPRWKQDLPLYGYLNGMYAFGLVETKDFGAAEKYAIKGLDWNPKDCWSTHTRAHVFEMQGRQDDGIKFMSNTQKDWTSGTALACHNFWHWSLYYVEKGDHQAALDIYDQEIGERCKAGFVFNLSDASSLLYRLELDGVNVGNRWRELHSLWEPHADDHILSFYDAHLLMCSLGAKNVDATLEFMRSFKKYVIEGTGTNWQVSCDVGLAVCEALVEADKGNFDKAVEIVQPVYSKIVTMGGSDAQRDVFSLFLIHAALQSPNPEHRLYGRELLADRRCRRGCSPLSDRLVARVMASHME